MKIHRLLSFALCLFVFMMPMFAEISPSSILSSVKSPEQSHEKFVSCEGKSTCEINLDNDSAAIVTPVQKTTATVAPKNIQQAGGVSTASVSQPVPTDDIADIMLNSAHPSETVKFVANPTTGYTWAAVDYDVDLLSVNHKYVSSATSSGLVGAGGNDYWTVTATPEALNGETKKINITFIYHRAWEQNIEPAETKTMTVQIN